MGELWDVVVVGVTDRTPQGVWRVASEISRLSGLDPNAVQQAVSQGPVTVHASMDPANAKGCRDALQGVGAVVELRPAADRSSPGAPGRSGQGLTAVGHVSHEATGGNAGEDWAAALDIATSNLEESDLEALDGSVEIDHAASPPPPGSPASHGRKGVEMDARFGGELAADQRAVTHAEERDRDAAPGDDDDDQLVAGAPKFNDEELQLDLDVAEMARPASALHAKKLEGGPSEASGATPLSEASGTGGQPELPEAARVFASPAPAPVVRLFGSDPITVALLAACIGLWVGLLPAMKAARGIERDEILPREEELGRVINRPLAVRAGKVTSPDEIVRDIRETFDGVRTRYYLTWIGIAVPIGLILGFVRRPGT